MERFIPDNNFLYKIFVSNDQGQKSFENFGLKEHVLKENLTMENIEKIINGRQMENKPFYAVNHSHFENLPSSITKFNITSNSQGKINVNNYSSHFLML